MITTVAQTSTYHTTKGLNLDSGTRLLVGTRPIKEEVGGDLKVGETTIRKYLESASKKVGKTAFLPLEGGVGGDLKVNIIRKEGETSTRKVGKTTIEEKVAETGVGDTTTLRRAGGTLV